MSISRAAAVAGEGGWRWVALVVALLVVMHGLGLALDMPLLDPSEGLHAAIAQEMVEGGDWITPRLFGKPFRDKPILYFWAEAAALASLGMTVTAFRLPGVLLAILGAAATGLLASRLFGHRAGLLAAVFHATMLLPAALAQAPVHDVALVPLVTLAILGLWEADHATTWPRRLAAGAAVGLVLGLAALVKGLPGVAVVGVAYGLCVLATRGPVLLRRIRGRPTPADAAMPPLGPLVVVGSLALVIGGCVAAPWYLAQEARDPGYLRYFFVERHVGGFTAGGQCHDGRPWWYYLPILLVGGMPAIAYLPAAILEARSRRDDDHRGLILAGAWLLGGAIFFSAANSKLVTYVWPLMPPIAVLAAFSWDRIIAGTAAPATRRWTGIALAAACLAGLPALPAGLLAARRFADVPVPAVAWLAVLPVALCALVPLACWRRGRPAAAVAAGSLALAAQFAVLMTCLVAPWFRSRSPRDLADAFNERGNLPALTVFIAERPHSLVFYLDPALRRGLEAERFLMCSPADAALLPPAVPGEVVVYPRDLAPDGAPEQRIGRWWIYPADSAATGRAVASRR